jgi:hypothetical protein
VATGDGVVAPKLEPLHLEGTPDEAYQENECFKLELPGVGTTLDNSRSSLCAWYTHIVLRLFLY